ncbi:methionine aminopeptidase, type I [Candidatus Endolissoclinum faulkneri L5]|uniref:Methionine aminopeptidase n=1 Tax=Candidatus Endolissoclinum faulkneri L5 TaxID=1401328 RepID=V9TX54_9PROT|nr:type I methionyl aminopeptidase [Candidatus Endolissoclinum faulkneri]AHC73915.1 methionine aminopeptidase, type I [Candidatus Endolissoclinum faulkneri L5]
MQLTNESRCIVCHPDEDFEGMRKAGRLAAEILDMITEHVIPGVSTDRLDLLCHQMILDSGGIPAPLGYKGFPKAICTSINHVVCHGIPSNRRLQEGDIVNIDVTVILDGWYGDTSRMYLVGEKISVKAKRLVEVTYQAMMLGIQAISPVIRLGAIGNCIQGFVEANSFSVVRDFCGHGLGRTFHNTPSILHYGHPERGICLEQGMFFTVEPMVNAGKSSVKILSDGWTAVTRDRSLSAQFEHSVGVTENGFEIFTLSPRGYTKPPYL